MLLDEAKLFAQQGVKITHYNFTSDEYFTMRGNIIIFEDGCQIFFNEWIEGKDWVKDGWSKFE